MTDVFKKDVERLQKLDTTYRPDFCRSMLRKNANMFFSKKKLQKESKILILHILLQM